MKGRNSTVSKGKQHMKTRKIVKTKIDNTVLIEQLQNGRCILARGVDMPVKYCWQLEEPTLTDEQQKALNEYHNIIDNISDWKIVVNDLMINSNKKWYKVKYEIASDIVVYYDHIETIYHFTFNICELTKDGYFKPQWLVQGF